MLPYTIVLELIGEFNNVSLFPWMLNQKSCSAYLVITIKLLGLESVQYLCVGYETLFHVCLHAV